ncbi:MAG: hypothetical protein HY730_08980 [Candidatus Tectomicrobia bacterium]|uniref:Uncharacterized protein n=1 Tax=Tectimicrobiota bacterium TaxID=2528274 RepID=A0A933LRM4_UNCTE|nr:hypothetical protein [Candidatus Tectomicrobia bacterium]
MRQLLVECSDPGLVVTLEEEFEHVLKNVDFEVARGLQSQFAELAHELGREFEELWRGFHLEVTNDGNDFPPSFGNRDTVDEEKVKVLVARAQEKGIGRFSIRDTLLLPQGGPTPETRDQFIHDLADAIRYSSWYEIQCDRRPLTFPESMERNRQQIMEEYVYPDLRRRAQEPMVGYKWVQESIERLRKSLEEADTRSQAVMEYELSRIDPAQVELEDKVHWAVLACSLGREVEKWFTACAKELPHIYQRAALIAELWGSFRSVGRARPFLQERFKELIEESAALYTDDARQAMRQVYDELCQSPWDRRSGLLDKKEEGPENETPDSKNAGIDDD